MGNDFYSKKYRPAPGFLVNKRIRAPSDAKVLMVPREGASPSLTALICIHAFSPSRGVHSGVPQSRKADILR